MKALIATTAFFGVTTVGLTVAAIWSHGETADKLAGTAFVAFALAVLAGGASAQWMVSRK